MCCDCVCAQMELRRRMILSARRRSVVPGGAMGWEAEDSWAAGDDLGAHWSESGLLEGDELDWSGDAFTGLHGLRRGGKLSAVSAAAAARTKRNYTYEDLCAKPLFLYSLLDVWLHTVLHYILVHIL